MYILNVKRVLPQPRGSCPIPQTRHVVCFKRWVWVPRARARARARGPLLVCARRRMVDANLPPRTAGGPRAAQQRQAAQEKAQPRSEGRPDDAQRAAQPRWVFARNRTAAPSRSCGEHHQRRAAQEEPQWLCVWSFNQCTRDKCTAAGRGWEMWSRAQPSPQWRVLRSPCTQRTLRWCGPPCLVRQVREGVVVESPAQGRRVPGLPTGHLESELQARRCDTRPRATTTRWLCQAGRSRGRGSSSPDEWTAGQGWGMWSRAQPSPQWRMLRCPGTWRRLGWRGLPLRVRQVREGLVVQSPAQGRHVPGLPSRLLVLELQARPLCETRLRATTAGSIFT